MRSPVFAVLLFALPASAARQARVPVLPASAIRPAALAEVRLAKTLPEKGFVAGTLAASRRFEAAPREELRLPEAASTVSWMLVELAKRRKELEHRPAAAHAIAGLEAEIAALRVPEGPAYEPMLKAAWKFSRAMDYEPYQQESHLAFLLSTLERDTTFLEFLRQAPRVGLLIPAPQALLDAKEVFVEAAGLPVAFVGLVTKRTPVDGITMSPADFFYHDLSHAYQRAQVRIETAKRRGLSRADAARLFTSVHDSVRREISRISDPRLRKQAVDIWFEFDHESGKLLPNAEDYAKRVEGAGDFFEGYPIDAGVMGRLQRAQRDAQRRFNGRRK